MKMRSKYIALASVFIAALALVACVAQNTGFIPTPLSSLQWHKVQDGLFYVSVPVTYNDKTQRDFFVVKIDPALFEFRVFQNTDLDSAKNLDQIHASQHAVLSFNGAFFDEQFKAMGMLQDSTATFHKKSASQLMNGVFLIPNKQENLPPKIFTLSAVLNDQESFMIQNGPILIDGKGKILVNTDTQKLAARTALGVDGEGNVVLIILHQDLLHTDNTLSLYRFAHLLEEQDFFVAMHLHDVLNLDGGVSTGVSIDNQYLPELSPVQNAVFVLPRTAKI